MKHINTTTEMTPTLTLSPFARLRIIEEGCEVYRGHARLHAIEAECAALREQLVEQCGERLYPDADDTEIEFVAGADACADWFNARTRRCAIALTEAAQQLQRIQADY